MLSREFTTPLCITLRPSPLLRRLFILAPLLLFTSLLYLDSWPLRLLVPLAIALAGRSVWSARPELSGSGGELCWEGDGRWWWQGCGESMATQLWLSDESVVTPVLVVLAFRDRQGRYHHYLLLADMLDATEQRRLRVRLKSGRRQPVIGTGVSQVSSYRG